MSTEEKNKGMYSVLSVLSLLGRGACAVSCFSVHWVVVRGLLCFSVLLPLPINAAFEFLPVGAQAVGAGSVGVAVARGAEGAFWNPAAVAFGRRGRVFASAERPFGMADLDTQALGVAIRVRKLGLGVTYQGYGFSLYREQVLGAAVAWRVSEWVGLGVRIRVLSVSVLNRESQRWTVFDLGIRARLHDRVWWGASARNAGGIRTGVLGQGGATGLGIGVGDRATVVIDVHKEAGLSTGVGMGVMIQVAEALVVRLGTGGHPERFSGGFGVRRGLLCVDYAASWHTILGLSHSLSLGIGN